MIGNKGRIEGTLSPSMHLISDSPMDHDPMTYKSCSICPSEDMDLYCSTCGEGGNFTHTEMPLAGLCSACTIECSASAPKNSCRSCKSLQVSCSVCQLPVRNMSNFCTACKHGGHATHIQDWFESHVVCPAGCGCHCLEATGRTKPVHGTSTTVATKTRAGWTRDFDL
ncbi:unnamed protein product [Discosporangium mesarthrocarpum]